MATNSRNILNNILWSQKGDMIRLTVKVLQYLHLSNSALSHLQQALTTLNALNNCKLIQLKHKNHNTGCQDDTLKNLHRQIKMYLKTYPHILKADQTGLFSGNSLLYSYVLYFTGCVYVWKTVLKQDIFQWELFRGFFRKHYILLPLIKFVPHQNNRI